MGGSGEPGASREERSGSGILLGLAAISMMFIGLTSAYVVNQGLGPLWKQVHMRPLIWINTAVLLLSSFTMEVARREIVGKVADRHSSVGAPFSPDRSVFSPSSRRKAFI